ncbi:MULTISPECIES: NAD(+) synthase [unclassified Alistipes]|jgi:NAD+ synthase (glutamine-hydrolysing)|uniref:NAD(+) synthase n=1 Tax=unclassified Alistipes TaxID=2608932 RepID=UPI000D1114C7|nr:NAD(+) synthase [Alistipes sp. Marseille-P5061]
MDNYGFVKVAAAVPQVAVADCARNAERIVALAQQAARRGVELVAFPELAVTGYTCADLFLQPALLDAADEALGEIMRQTRKLPLALIVGLPLRHEDRLYNCAAVVAQGRLLGVVPKSYIPNYAEFYEARWFASGAGIEEERITAAGQEADFGTELTFAVNGAEFGIEICEDLWVASPPSSRLALNGAKLIFNLSASPEGVGKHAYLRELVAQQSARTHTAYVYCSAGFGESSTDLVFAGNGLIAENGTMLAQAARFSLDEQLTVADVDIERLEFERRRNTSFRMREEAGESTVIEMELPDALKASALDRRVDPMPFVPADEAHRSERCEEIFQIQSHGLARRLAHTGCRCAVVGISGGLDSTLALLVTVRTFDKLGLDRRGILGITMPGFGTTDRTYRNALKLMEGLGVTVREIPIRDACLQHFRDIGLPESDRSAAYENAQARERTQILMDVANMEGGLVIGTGDLSELALGWATYNGDQMSMYGVNASVPKTLVRHLVRWAADTERDGATRATLLDIIDTPVSPELLPADREGNIAQKTEDLVGPYELHDFFLYNFVRAGFRPAKIAFLAEQAFAGSYDRETIVKWLRVFFRRFFAQQFKRSAMPDGPKVGSVSLSPRGDWRMPSDASAALWLRELEEL